VRPDNPWARAARMKSLPITASMDPRVMRAIGATANTPMVSAGNTSCAAAELQVSQSPATAASIR